MNCFSRRTRAERLGQPEQALDRHVHDEFGNLLAGREMHDMAHAVHGALDAVTVGNRAFHHLEPRRGGKPAIVAERADDQIGPRRQAQPPDQVDPTFPVAPVIRSFIVFLPPAGFVEGDCQRAGARRQATGRMINAQRRGAEYRDVSLTDRPDPIAPGAVGARIST